MRLRKLKHESFDAATKILLFVVYANADDEGKRILKTQNSTTGRILAAPRDTVTTTVSKRALLIGPDLDSREVDVESDETEERATGSTSSVATNLVKGGQQPARLKNGTIKSAAKTMPTQEQQGEIGDITESLLADSKESKTSDEKHQEILTSMETRWGAHWAIPAPQRGALERKDTVKRLRSLYNKIDCLGENAVTYLWKEPDGLLTRECRENPKDAMSTLNIQRILRELNEKYPELAKAKTGSVPRRESKGSAALVEERVARGYEQPRLRIILRVGARAKAKPAESGV